jgi:Mce-associated membrane protein
MSSDTEQDTLDGTLDEPVERAGTLDDGVEATADPEPKPNSRLPRFANPAVGWAWTAAVFMLVCALIFGGLWFFSARSDSVNTANEREAVLNAAKQGVINFTSLDYNHAAQGLANWQASSTGGLAQEFTQGKTLQQYEQILKQDKIVLTGQVEAATVTDLQPTSATALVYVLVTGKFGTTAQTPTYLPIACGLVLTNGQWKISSIGEPNNPFTGTSGSGNSNGNPLPSGSASTSASQPPTSTSKPPAGK